MQQHRFGRMPPVSALTLGGGGLGMVWGETTFEECVLTVHAAVEAGITLLDLAPRYGDGKAEEVVGAAFAGQLPAGVRVTSKCNLGDAAPARIEALLRQSIEGSLKRLRLTRLDLGPEGLAVVIARHRVLDVALMGTLSRLAWWRRPGRAA